jgi:hypothetical protein
MSSRKSVYITEVRELSRDLWRALNELEALQKEWNALDYSNVLRADAFEGNNSDLQASEVGAVVFDTVNALRGVLDQGHATNLAKLL